eukprot:CAMPEP_0170326430 /NCGR_PEP_ID=MMETSP0116_2-20130129/64093_1 /TAXON_ID=400756 /ORGANISM="Durinskia baltica, Strain CSIRO CS-38" /LENGTH=87 /DNA_ID=CAMNT_0010579489 /DNA_START=15 /DNA_END=275 /DNA_ORIENTATION=-
MAARATRVSSPLNVLKVADAFRSAARPRFPSYLPPPAPFEHAMRRKVACARACFAHNRRLAKLRQQTAGRPTAARERMQALSGTCPW